MLNKKDFHPCPVGLFLQLVGNKWKILIIRDLLSGTKRFGQLRRSVGCSQKVLTDNLRDLEENGLLLRKVYAEVPPRVEYTLSPTGDSLRPVLDTIAAWGESYRQSR
ncbi:MAG: helix-turn-helix transcriptional regulator [Elusimicrobiaceae bacterium]|nr:helix-turn-helix transcriptional regulator [Elusimicrobiaceae bacterium]MBP3513647.1 helix-turn-helix transcriptional regulator [Elusimicrobiaceae bacterium]